MPTSIVCIVLRVTVQSNEHEIPGNFGCDVVFHSDLGE